MILPDGIPQSSACVLIAMREFFDDPTWEDAELINELRTQNASDKLIARSGNTAGYPAKRMPALLERSGMFTADDETDMTIFLVDGSANSDRIGVRINKQLQYAFPRLAKCVLVYYTSKDRKSSHAICLPLHVAYCFAVNCVYGWRCMGIDTSGMQFLGVKL